MAASQQPTTADDADEEIERLNEKINGAFSKISELVERVDDLEGDKEELQQDNHALRQRVSQLESRTDLLRMVEQTDDMTGKQRSVTLLQHLQKAAQSSGDGEAVTASPKASVTREQAEIALQHPDVDRTTIYDDMRRAVRLVGDESVCWYDSSGAGAALHLDLSEGAIPAEFGGGE